VTSPLHVPTCAPANSIVPAKRRLIWRRRPARDIGGPVPSRPVPSGVAWRSRWQRFRARSSLRTAGRSASRRAFSCLPRRRSRHFFPQVFWVFAVDGAGVYQHRHSQQRRRAVSSCCPIPGPSPEGGSRATSQPRSSRRSGGRGGSQDRRRLDLRLAAAKAGLRRSNRGVQNGGAKLVASTRLLVLRAVMRCGAARPPARR
jgi:hypothetical protein